MKAVRAVWTNEILPIMEEFQVEALASISGNQAASRRARVLSKKLEKVLKKFRKASMEVKK